MSQESSQAINVSIGATNNGANEAFIKLGQSIEQLSGQIKQQIADAGKSIQESIQKGTDDAAKSVEKLKKGFTFTTIATSIQPLVNMFGGLKNKIDETVGAAMNWNSEVVSLSKTLGTSTTEAGGLAKALEKLNVSTDQYRGAVFQLQRSLNTNEEQLNKNGIATRNAKGEMLDMQVVMMNTINRLREMKPGYDANQLAMLAFGRGAKELEGVMKLTNEKIEDGTKKVRELGIEVDAESTGLSQTPQKGN
jgi:chromosome segregation ATPase